MSVTFFPQEIKGGVYLPPSHHTFGDGINVANSNAADLLEAMGLPREAYTGGELPIDQFINRARNYLRSHVGKPSEAIPPEVEKEPGKVEIIFFGRRPGYVNEKLLALVKMAEEGKSQGATLICWG